MRKSKEDSFYFLIRRRSKITFFSDYRTLRMVKEIYTLALFFVDSEDFSCLVVTYNIKERPNLDPTIVVDLLTIQLTHFFTPPSYHYYRLLLP